MSYTLGGETHDGVFYVSYSRNALGSITGTRFILFFYDWNIGSLMGAQDVQITPILYNATRLYYSDLYEEDGTHYVRFQGSTGGRIYTDGLKINNEYIGPRYTVTISSGIDWMNQITISDRYGGSDLDVALQREYGTKAYASTLDIRSPSGSLYSSFGTTDVSLLYPVDNVVMVNVTSPSGQVYSYPQSLYTPDEPEYSPMLYGEVIDIYTGDPISGATITATQSAISRTLSTTSDTSGEYAISPGPVAGYPITISASASGYQSASLSFAEVPRYSSWYVPLLMVPTTAPDIPTDPEKSMLYGYVITQGSQQPIQGATVTLSGVGSTTTSSTGFFVFNNITADTYTISASAPYHTPLSESVTVGATATQHNLALEGTRSLTVTVKDANDLTLVPGTTITLSDGQTATGQNPATFNVDYGQYTISVAAEGYYPGSQYVYVDRTGTTTATVLMTAIAATPDPADLTNYPPHNVRFHCIDDYGGPLSNVSVSAEYLETTSPWSWFTDLLGIPSTVAINETTLAGTTGTDGSITFSMVEVVRYAITAHDPASNLSVNFTLYPQETQYTIQFRTRPPSDAETHPLYELEAVPLEGDTQVSLRLAYKDRDNATTSIWFWVKDGAGEYVHTDTLEPTLLNWTNTSYTVENHPASYTWGFDATHATRDTISAARTITLHGSGRLVDLGFEDDFWYYLLSAIWIVGIGAIFSGSRVRFGAIIIPLIGGGVPTLIGWLPAATAGLIGILVFIGVFVYMRKSEYKLYR